MNNAGLKTLIHSCPLCGSTQPQELFVIHENSFLRCQNCHLFYQNPLPSMEETRQFYTEEYYSGLAERTVLIKKARYPIFKKALQEFASFRKTGRILDVGSGMGEFLELAQEEGWEGWGIEPSPEGYQASKEWLGNRVLNQTVEEANFADEYFDVITIWNVLDCFPVPLPILQKIHRWLAPGGILVIRTPNTFFHCWLYRVSLALRPLLKKIGWQKNATAFHGVNYEAKALRWLLGKSGFSYVRIDNGEITQGDPYGYSASALIVPLAKSLLYGLSVFVSFITGGRVLIGSTLMARAIKNGGQKMEMKRDFRILLKKIILHLLAVLGYCLGFPIWLKFFAYHKKLRILLYHSVDEAKKGDLNVAPSQFEKQISFLKNHYDVISLKKTSEYLVRGNLPERSSVAITFDDGYEDNYRFAYPVLKRQNCEATIFLLTGGEGGERYAGHLYGGASGEHRLLNWNQIAEMSRHGITFGSHGENHIRLKKIPEPVLQEEIRRSKEKIENKISGKVEFFSYPYGTWEDFDKQTENLVRSSGYLAACSALFGVNDAETDRYSIRRIGIEASDTLFTFRAKLNGALAFLVIFNQPWIRRLIRWIDQCFLKMSSSNLIKQKSDAPLLLVSVDFPPHTDGVSTISKELVEKIAAANKEIIAIGPKDRGDREYDQGKNFRVYRVPGYHWGHWRMLPMLFSMPFVILKHDVKKIFAMNIAYGGVIAWLMSYLKPLEYLIFAYGYEFEKVKNQPFAAWLYRKIYKRAIGIVVCSKEVKRRLIDFGVAGPKITVLYPAVDLKRYYPREVPTKYLEEKGLAGRKIILTVGRLVIRKGHDKILEALPAVISKFPDILYCIVGIGDQEEKLRQKVRELGLDKYVRFLGRVPQEELPLLYNACEVFAMPSREIEKGGHIEGFGIVFLEANACGKPVIGGKSGGVVEAIQDGRTGYLVNPLSKDEIAGKILEIFSHPEKAEAMGKAGLEWVRETFNWDDYVTKSYECLMKEELP